MTYNNDNKVSRSRLKDDPHVGISRQGYQITIINTLKKIRKGDQSR